MNFKLALVAAAVVGAASTAQAADLAKKAPAAANYVKVCDAYGAGFFYIPGSDTCLKIGGYVQAQYLINSYSKNAGGIWGWNNRGQNGISTQARAHISLDARTNTEVGLLRSFAEVRIDNSSYAANGNGASLQKAFIQFGGLTAGRATSFFDFFNDDYTQNAVLEATHADATVNLLAYTFSFGNGVTATLSIEDPSASDDMGRRNGYLSGGYNVGGTTYNTYGGVHTPDLVGNVNVAQAWGSAQAMFALHDDYASAPVGKVGYALGAGVKINVPALGAADQVALQVQYSKGATGYLSTFDYGFGGTGAADFYVSGGAVRQSTAWSVAAGFTHGFTKTITGNFEASFAQYKSDHYSSTVDFNQWDVIGGLTWSPVTNLAITGEVEYRNVDYTSTTTAASGLLDRNAVVGVIRVKRSF